MSGKKWEIKSKFQIIKNKLRTDEIVNILLKNRGVKTEKEKREFFEPTKPGQLRLRDFGIKKKEMEKAVARIKQAKNKGEKVVVYGDYDADGIGATAVLWECLYGLGIEAVPYIPERMSEGYGINIESIKKLNGKQTLKLIVTVDNGIVAHEAVEFAKSQGIDVIVTDHHSVGENLPVAEAVVHTTETSGSGIAWALARELGVETGLELVAVGTVADQIPLLGVNRSLVKYGLEELNKTERVGLLALFKQAAVERGNLGVYEINYVLAPRINAMGRLAEAMDSLRLLCTKKEARAMSLAGELEKTNQERQKMVGEAYLHAEKSAGGEGIIVVSHEEYHEGVIGLIASGLVEKFNRPAIVLSKGEKVSKASARSIGGFNIIEAIRSLDEYILKGGGHPMAAGFEIETGKIEMFYEKLQEMAEPLLTEEVLARKLKIDLEIDFSLLNWELLGEIEKFEPTGVGNPKPHFCTRGVEIIDMRAVGREDKHLKLRLKNAGREYEAIGFGLGYLLPKLEEGGEIAVAFNLERNVWNGRESVQLKIRDIRF